MNLADAQEEVKVSSAYYYSSYSCCCHSWRRTHVAKNRTNVGTLMPYTYDCDCACLLLATTTPTHTPPPPPPRQLFECACTWCIFWFYTRIFFVQFSDRCDAASGKALPSNLCAILVERIRPWTLLRICHTCVLCLCLCVFVSVNTTCA